LIRSLAQNFSLRQINIIFNLIFSISLMVNSWNQYFIHFIRISCVSRMHLFIPENNVRPKWTIFIKFDTSITLSVATPFLNSATYNRGERGNGTHANFETARSRKQFHIAPQCSGGFQKLIPVVD
jgi:hypothetical protein